MAPTVVSASIGVLGPLVVKLDSLLAGEYGRLKGIRKEILALNLELSTMHAAVQKKSITKLRELLKDKRYLIIIDDIWSTQAWNNIQCAFPENNYSSRIIITTRIIDVAKSCCSSTFDRTYNIEALSDLHARELFFKRIFGSTDGCPDMLKEVSDKILNKCGGLPLAIISISALLANRCTVKEEWEKVKRSIGPALEKHQTLEGMSTILSLSYNDLPPNLKTCLLYLSVFPEDYVITRRRLVRRWIAEGFVSEERGQSQYEVAESYFYELVNKSMVQPVDISYDGKVRACRVHDMMLEIIISKSAEDNFVTVVGGGRTSLSNRHGVIRRLSIQYIDNRLALALGNEDLSHVRSLTVTASGCIKHLPSLAEFEALRVLDFEGCDGLEHVEKFFQLKYLGLKDTDISRLPSRIVMLSDLETLDFRDTYGFSRPPRGGDTRELPAGFVQLTKLQYLLAGKGTKIPSGIGNMSNLRVISNVNATRSAADALEDLGNLTYLSELIVYLDCGGSVFGSKCGGLDAYRMHEEKLFSSLHKLIGSCKLPTGNANLVLLNADLHESWSPMPSALQMFRMTTDYYFPNIPMWISPALTSLASLNINLTELTEDGLYTLGELPALLHLYLTLETGEYKIAVQGIGFPNLKHFKISSGQGTYFTFVKGAMPKLEYLQLNISLSVGRNYGFYLGLAHLPCLRRVLFQYRGATISEVISAGAAIKEEVDAHTNHLRFDITKSDHW
ncbi:hypothetical protein ACQ4PT_002622 [Festuca glaucescens]